LLTVDEGGGLALQASRGGDIRISTTVRDKVLSERASVLVRDVTEDESIRASSATRARGVCSLVAVPLQSDERVIGMIYLDSCEPTRRFTRDDMNTLTALANIAGIRIELEEWELRKRELISENVENLARLTAALSHELSNPLGALKSSLDTLWRTTQRGGSPDERERAKLDRVQAELRVTLDASLDRMQSVIERIQRFANLDRAETRSIDVAELLEDVVALARTQPHSVAIELAVGELPRITCHPQPLSSAMASLLAYALDSCEAEDVDTVSLAAQARGDSVEIRIEFHGHDIPPDRLEQLFQPSFEIARKRVEARNWSLFSARQVVRDQGGDVTAFSEPGGNNGFVVELPPPAQG
jgi:signal transduction histidine kinase